MINNDCTIIANAPPSASSCFIPWRERATCTRRGVILMTVVAVSILLPTSGHGQDEKSNVVPRAGITTDRESIPKPSSLIQSPSVQDTRRWEAIRPGSKEVAVEKPPATPVTLPPVNPPPTISASILSSEKSPAAKQSGPSPKEEAESKVGGKDAYERFFNPNSVDEKIPHEDAIDGKALNFDQVINLCLLSDPRLRSGFEAINQANADALTSSLFPNPTIYTDIQMLPYSRPFTVTRQGGPPQQDALVTYPIDWFLFGKRAASMASAALGVRVSEAAYNDLVRQRVTEAALAYYDILEARELITLAKQEIESFQKVVEVTQKAVDSGGRPRVELQRIQLNLLNSEQDLRDAELAYIQAKTKLQPLLGRSVADPFIEVKGTLDVDPTLPEMSLEDAYTTAVENRPDLQALRFRVQQMRAQILVQRRAAMPIVAVTAGWTLQYQTKVLDMPNANSWDAAVQASIPIFDRNQGNRVKASSYTAQAQYDVRAAELMILAEIEAILKELTNARTNAQFVTSAKLKLASEVRDSFIQAYQVGGRPILDVIDSQRTYRETYQSYIVTRANYWRAVYKFSASIGRQLGNNEPSNP